MTYNFIPHVSPEIHKQSKQTTYGDRGDNGISYYSLSN